MSSSAKVIRIPIRVSHMRAPGTPTERQGQTLHQHVRDEDLKSRAAAFDCASREVAKLLRYINDDHLKYFSPEFLPDLTFRIPTSRLKNMLGKRTWPDLARVQERSGIEALPTGDETIPMSGLIAEKPGDGSLTIVVDTSQATYAKSKEACWNHFDELERYFHEEHRLFNITGARVTWSENRLQFRMLRDSRKALEEWFEILDTSVGMADDDAASIDSIDSFHTCLSGQRDLISTQQRSSQPSLSGPHGPSVSCTGLEMHLGAGTTVTGAPADSFHDWVMVDGAI